MCSLTVKHTQVVSTKCTPGFGSHAYSETILLCFIVNEHTTKCSHYRNRQPQRWLWWGYSGYICMIMLDDNKVDPLRAKLLIGKINIYSHFMSFLHTDFAQPVGINLLWNKDWPVLQKSISWLMMPWRRKERGHQQPYWLCWIGLIRSPHVKT